MLLYLGAGTSVAAHLIPALQTALGGCALVCCDHLPPNLSRRDFDAIIFPGGSGESQSVGLGLEGRERVKRFVCQEGGGYLGICGGAYLGCRGSFALSLLPCDPWAHSLWKRGEHLRGSIGVALGTPPGTPACPPVLDDPTDLVGPVGQLTLYRAALQKQRQEGGDGNTRLLRFSCNYHNGALFDTSALDPSTVMPIGIIHRGTGRPNQSEAMRGKAIVVAGVAGGGECTVHATNPGTVVLCGCHPEKDPARLRHVLRSLMQRVLPPRGDSDGVTRGKWRCACERCTPPSAAEEEAQYLKRQRFRARVEALEQEWMSAHSTETVTMDRLAEVRRDIVRRVREMQTTDESESQACVTHTNKKDSSRKGFVADLLAVMKDCSVMRIVQSFLANSFKDQAHLATASTTAFRSASNTHLSVVTLSQGQYRLQRSRLAKRIQWSAVSKLRFSLQPHFFKLPTRYIAENAQGLNPTCVRITVPRELTFVPISGQTMKVKLMVARAKAHANEAPPDDLLAARLYAKHGEISEELARDALAQVEWDEELAMYYLLADNTAKEDEVVQRVYEIFSFARPIVRAVIAKHAPHYHRAINYLKHANQQLPRVFPAYALSRLADALDTSSGGECRLRHLQFDISSESRCFTITDQGLLRIAKTFCYLQTLHFATESILGADIMQTFVDGCPCIEDITIRSPDQKGVVPLSSLKRLHTLVLLEPSMIGAYVLPSVLPSECPYVTLLTKLKENQLRNIRLECALKKEVLELLSRQHGSLRTLSLSHTSFFKKCDINGLLSLAKKFPPYLESLELASDPAMAYMDGERMPENAFRACRTLKLVHGVAACAEVLVSACGALEDLYISTTQLKVNSSVHSSFASCRERLRSLSLSIPDELLCVPSILFPKLERLVLGDKSANSHVSRPAVNAQRTCKVTTPFLRRHSDTLRHLGTGAHFLASDGFLETIAQTLPRLHTLRLHQQRPLCITDDGLRALARSMFRLESFVCDCLESHRITKEGVWEAGTRVCF